jgi:hypothetical protein
VNRPKAGGVEKHRVLAVMDLKVRYLLLIRKSQGQAPIFAVAMRIKAFIMLYLAMASACGSTPQNRNASPGFSRPLPRVGFFNTPKPIYISAEKRGELWLAINLIGTT